ncbi:MAG TPA: hypothetical protein P5120_12675 [Spirochaetota bacterium]|nr:hypothetical protein [Spirochaetota bacterium]HPF04705.1 hypothetical protein [Spirochaetota bacterium]HRX48365.1 hypothetical protein [Spirochaetota bacterium]
MKFIKTLTIVFIVSFAVLPVFSQDAAEDNKSSVEINEQDATGVNDYTVSEKETVESKDESASGNKRVAEDKVKSGSSAGTAKKKEAASQNKKDDAPPADEGTPGEDYLLSISEGNFKYKRIPDIKLADRTPSMAEQNAQNVNNESDDQNNPDSLPGEGFFGLSKKTADIVAKGGILLLLLGIFILYRLRSRGGGRRGSGTRVMKSYRK